MASNCAKDQIGRGHLPTTLREKKIIWMTKRMIRKREKTKKVRDDVSSEDFHKVLTSTIIER
jgi:hypothetical protein